MINFIKLERFLALFYFFLLIIFHILILRKKLIIVCDKYGRMGNRLFLFTQLIEFSYQNGHELWLPGFHDYKKFFESTKDKKFIRFPLGRINIPNPFSEISTFNAFNQISKLLKKLGNNRLFQNINSYSQTDNDPFKRINSASAKCILFNGFIFHQHFLCLKHAYPTIKKMFKPSSQYNKLIEEPVRKLRASSDIVVGVLIRQTDYREWNEGKCFFTSSQYANILLGLEASFGDQNLSFFIATDEQQELSTFKSLNSIIRVGFPVENLYSLARCDILIGPSSSYIGWAALYGKLSLFTIQSPDDSPTVNDFNLKKS